ncbi:TonB-dependent receptor [Sediminitomix flava]|uniref:Carboxypeptidase-like protein n=1 Tax=Sediminitomix flava TaxID=379075 RepID=A0A315ZGD9_SEDFL|nr:TonB-dependent receptor [Sediminitomix flava]PWJ44209.1 carboxypeptidase-like protein [Sediminitomix flava]
MTNKLVSFLIIILIAQQAVAQNITQEIKGKVIDVITGEPLIGATVSIENTNTGAITNQDGHYTLESVSVGRHTIVVSYMGYKQSRLPGILVTSSKPLFLDVKLEEDSEILEGVVVTARKGSESYNTMAPVSARSFTVEESSRFAGGLSDPSRVAYNFAGVTFSAPQDNGVVIRGNSPNSVLWRLNGMDVPGAAHFGGGNLAGAGLISIYSSNMLKGSDFFSGAFPAEFSNATSGVFDVSFRQGNNEEHQHMAQMGILGVDLASEGPINKDKGSSYLVNYRHGFIGYYGELAGGAAPHFQDLSFNLSFPSKQIGDISVWGMGGLSSNPTPFKKYQVKHDEDKDEYNIKYRTYFQDFLEKDIHFGMGAVGINHNINVGGASALRSNIGYTTNYYKNDVSYFTQDADTLNTGSLSPYAKYKTHESKLEFSTRLYSKLSRKITNETGVRASLLHVDSYASEAPQPTSALHEHYNVVGNSFSVSAFTQFKFSLSPTVDLTTGLSTTKFEMVDEVTLEPRIGLNWQYLPFANFGLAYGRHTKREELKTYFYKRPEDNQFNDLKLSKADHYVLSLGFDLSENTSLTIEAYYQELFDVPVIEGTPYSFANYSNVWQVDGAITNDGTGTNIGVDVSLERKMDRGFYYLLTASIFDSKYTDAMNIERNTLYNRNYMATLALGKEFVVKKKNLLGFNFNATYMGGGRLTPYLEAETHENRSVVNDETRLYEWQGRPEFWLNAGITYKINKERTTRTWGLDFQNAVLTQQMAGYKYNLRENTIDEDNVLFLIPNLYYKIEF